MYFPESVLLPRIKTIHGIVAKKEKKMWQASRSVNGESLSVVNVQCFALCRDISHAVLSISNVSQ